ncbi:MAG: TPM domain-containing protein [Luteolibacter sp.]
MLSYPRTATLVGALPRLAPVVADTTGQLKGGVVAKLKRQITRMQRRYPQLVVQVVMHGFPAEHPFQMHAFWLFNAGAFAGEAKRGKNNHAIMVVVDPFRKESAIVPGYGLEPLLPKEALDHLLEMAGPAFESAKWELGFTVMLEGLDQLLETVTVADEVGEVVENDF